MTEEQDKTVGPLSARDSYADDLPDGTRLLVLRNPESTTVYYPISNEHDPSVRAWCVDRLLTSNNFRFSIDRKEEEDDYIDRLLSQAEKIKDYIQRGPEDA